MKRSLLLLLSSLLSASAFAAPPKNEAVVALVNKAYVTPLHAREEKRSRYSRVAMPPGERRVKVVDVQTDATGAEFVDFVVEQRFAFDPDAKWTKAESGCAYVSTGAVFVKRGDKLRAADFYLGKKAADPPATACVVSSSRV